MDLGVVTFKKKIWSRFSINAVEFECHLQEFLTINITYVKSRKVLYIFFHPGINTYLMKFYLMKYHLYFSDVQSMKKLNWGEKITFLRLDRMNLQNWRWLHNTAGLHNNVLNDIIP